MTKTREPRSLRGSFHDLFYWMRLGQAYALDGWARRAVEAIAVEHRLSPVRRRRILRGYDEQIARG